MSFPRIRAFRGWRAPGLVAHEISDCLYPKDCTNPPQTPKPALRATGKLARVFERGMTPAVTLAFHGQNRNATSAGSV